MLNSVSLMGRLTTTPELRTTASGIAMTNFCLAVDRNYNKSGEERQADFIDAIAWRNTAEFLCKYFRKGQLIAIEGFIQTDTYDDKQGIRRKSFQIVAERVHFAGSKKDEPQETNTEKFEEIEVDDSDLPF